MGAVISSVATDAGRQGIGSVKEDKTSHDRSKTEYVVTDPYAGARKAQKTSALLQQHTSMLLQVPFRGLRLALAFVTALMPFDAW